MHLISPDILIDGKGLSVVACGIGLGVGLFVWLLGGWGHRFWIVLLATLAAGAHGLTLGEAFGVQPLVSALLLGLASGVLALALARVGAFIAGGMIGCLLAERIIVGWQEPFVFFFVGGFLGLLLLRFWFMVLSSLGGSLISAHSLLLLLDSLGSLDALDFCNAKPVLLDWACGGAACVGLLLQVALERRRRPRPRGWEYDEEPRGGGPSIFRWMSFGGGGDKRRRRAA